MRYLEKKYKGDTTPKKIELFHRQNGVSTAEKDWKPKNADDSELIMFQDTCKMKNTGGIALLPSGAEKQRDLKHEKCESNNVAQRMQLSIVIA